MPNAHPEQILKLPTESFASALRELDPASRALLDLSLRRGMRPDEIADMLGADETTVVSSRDHALDQLAADLGAPRDQLDDLRARLAELPPDEWTGVRAEPSNGAGAAAVAGGPRAKKERPRGRMLLVALLVLAIAGIVVAIVIGSRGSSDNSKKTSRPASAPAPAPTKPGAPAVSAPVTAVGTAATHVTGTARVSGGRLALAVSGLPAPAAGGSYEVWLYKSVIDAVPLGSSHSAHVVVNAQLPSNARRYRFVDVSYEPNDGNPSHSGQSVARVPLAKLAQR